MNMEQIAKLLFAATLLSIFAYLLIFTSLGRAGNGGENWGFDGHTEPRSAAANSYEAGDYLFLTADIREPGVSSQFLTPNFVKCFDRSSRNEIQTRTAVIDAALGDASRRLAFDFADQYNRQLAQLLYKDMKFDCEHLTD